MYTVGSKHTDERELTMKDIKKGATVYRHTRYQRNVPCKVNRVTKRYVFATAIESDGTVEDKYHRDTGKLVNQVLGQNEFITLYEEYGWDD
jgi:hypothetical protein